MSFDNMRGEIMSFLTNSLQTLPNISTLVTWQNNVTRLNQSNLNNMTNGISSVITSLKSFGTDVTDYFNSIDTEISTLKKEDRKLTLAVKENTDFRESHSEDFEGLTEVFRYQFNRHNTTPFAGVVYSNADYPLVIQSQLSPLELRGTQVIVDGKLSGTVAIFSKIEASTISSRNSDLFVATPEAKFSTKVSAQSVFSDTAVHTSVTAGKFIDTSGNVLTDFSKLRLTTETYIAKGPADYTDKSLMV